MKLRIIKVSSALCLLYYFFIVAFGGFSLSWSWLWLLASLFFGFSALILTLDKKKPFLCKIPKAVILVPTLIIIMGMLCFEVLFSLVLSESGKKADNGADYVVVLGAKTTGGYMPRILKYRLDAALLYAEENPDCMVIVSGGKGNDEEKPEAEVMKEYLLKQGLAENRIITEDKSRNTDENLSFSKKLIEEISPEGKENRIVIITNTFHVYRAVSLAKAKGMENAEGYAAKSRIEADYHYSVRECIGLMKELVFGNIGFKDLIH